jgi:hypothetical protein
MMNSYSGNGPWTEKLFLYLLEFTFSIALWVTPVVAQNYHIDYSGRHYWRTECKRWGSTSNSGHEANQAQSTNQLKGLDTRHNTHWFMEGTGTGCHVYSSKTKQQVWNSSVFQHAAWDCVLLCVARYIIPNCISECHFTPNWTGIVHRQK